MELLRELTRLQEENGFLDDAVLRELSARQGVPLYRLEGLVSFYPHFRTDPPPAVTVHVCRDVACAMAGCESHLQRLKQQLNGRNDVELIEVSCLGRCEHAPALNVNEVPLAPQTLAETDAVLACIDEPTLLPADEPTESPRQWRCDPYTDVTARYGTVQSLLKTEADIGGTCIERLKASDLRGMGGAGFPAGLKWELVAKETAGSGERGAGSAEREDSPLFCATHSNLRAPTSALRATRYVICNADESEPGTFKDRVILEELPHLIIEGMLLAGLTAGAETGIVFLRHEYSKERKALQAAIDRAKADGILGEDAAGSGRRFDIEIFLSPGGYILGEETALLETLEDKRGEPRNKPPYPVTHGLWGQPTLINNVETFALAASIIHHGPDWWQDQGKGDFAGLKFVSVSGDVEQPGVYEIPFGTTVAELIETAGGVKDGKPLKAFLPGGASSNFLPANCLETPLDFQAMQEAGSMLGTGAVIVFADDRDLFALATNLVRFFRNESCGKCVPCRIGSEQAVTLLDAAGQNGSAAADLSVLPELGETLEQTSICGLGQVALNPILSMMKHFPQEIPG